MKNKIMRALLIFIIMISLSMQILAPNAANYYEDTYKKTYTTKRLNSIQNAISINEIHKKKQNKCLYGYAICNVNIRKQPTLNSEILDVCNFNKRILYEHYNNDWIKTTIYDDDCNAITAYIYRKYVADSPCQYIEYSIPANNGFKSYMSYESITDTTSKQYKLQQDYAYVGDCGIRKVNDRYCIAIGTAFNAEIGDYADIILKNDEVIPAIISDIKSDEHTNSDNIFTKVNGCATEFIVDIDMLNAHVKKRGDISYCKKEWNDVAIRIKIYNKNIFDEGES